MKINRGDEGNEAYIPAVMFTFVDVYILET